MAFDVDMADDLSIGYSDFFPSFVLTSDCLFYDNKIETEWLGVVCFIRADEVC